MQKKVLNTQVKAMSELEFRACASDESIDRDGDQILLSAWDTASFEKNCVILFGHDYSKPPVARAKRIYKDTTAKRLMVDIEFPPAGVYEFADTLRKLAKGGFLNTLSVGFLGKKFEPMPSGGRKYTACELLEISLVPVPSNSNSLIQMRSKGILNDKEIRMLQGNTAVELSAATLRKIDEITKKFPKVPGTNEIDLSAIESTSPKNIEIDIESIPYDPYSGIPEKYADVKAELQRCYIPTRETIAAINKWRNWKPAEDKRAIGGLAGAFGVPVKNSEKLAAQAGIEELRKVRGY